MLKWIAAASAVAGLAALVHEHARARGRIVDKFDRHNAAPCAGIVRCA